MDAGRALSGGAPFRCSRRYPPPRPPGPPCRRDGAGYFRDPARRATQEAAQAASLETIAILNEPVAAALAFGIRPGTAPAGDVFVFDLGGGTFDVTLVRMSATEVSVVGHGGDHLLGGKDWDEAILRELGERHLALHGVNPSDDPYAKQELYLRAEELKRALSSQTRAAIAYSFDGVMERFEMTREKFEAVTRHLVEATITKCEDLLASTSTKRATVGAVLLVRGSTRMPMVQAAVEQYFAQRPNTTLNPDECVGIGAALRAFALTRARPAPTKGLPAGPPMKGLPARELRDAVAYSLGLVVVAADGSRYANAIMVPRNSPIPIERTESKIVHPTEDGPGTVEVWLTQGESLLPYENGLARFRATT